MNMNRNAEVYSSDIIDQVIEETSNEDANKIRYRMILAAKIDDGIKAKGWRKLDLANKLNKKPSVITKWISGTHNFTIDTLWDIEKLLEINLIRLDEPKKDTVIFYHVSLTSQKTTDHSIDYNSLILESMSRFESLKIEQQYKKTKNLEYDQHYS